jgi:regulator of protease activity HflC (stomatin/prohibitin superfamily)
MITAFIVGLICGLALGVAAILSAIWLIDPGHEGDAIDKGKRQQEAEHG